MRLFVSPSVFFILVPFYLASEILQVFCTKTDLPIPISPEFLGVLGTATNRRCWDSQETDLKLISREIIFEVFQAV